MRDKGSDSKQVLLNLGSDRSGFPKAYEIFEGNRQDRSTVGEKPIKTWRRWEKVTEKKQYPQTGGISFNKLRKLDRNFALSPHQHSCNQHVRKPCEDAGLALFVGDRATAQVSPFWILLIKGHGWKQLSIDSSVDNSQDNIVINTFLN